MAKADVLDTMGEDRAATELVERYLKNQLKDSKIFWMYAQMMKYGH
jgi:hypothetical protein